MKKYALTRKTVALLLTFALMAACCIAPVASAADSPGFYTIYLDYQGGIGSATQVYAYKGTWTGYRISSLPVPTMEGYTFEGWYDDMVGGEKVDADYEFAGDSSIYAHWAANGTAVQTTSPATTTANASGEGFRLKDHLGTVLTITSLTLVAFAVAAAN